MSCNLQLIFEDLSTIFKVSTNAFHNTGCLFLMMIHVLALNGVSKT